MVYNNFARDISDHYLITFSQEAYDLLVLNYTEALKKHLVEQKLFTFFKWFFLFDCQLKLYMSFNHIIYRFYSENIILYCGSLFNCQFLMHPKSPVYFCKLHKYV